MKLVEIARGHVVLEAYCKSIKIYDEALLRGHGSPDFVVYSNSIGRWTYRMIKGKFLMQLKTKYLSSYRQNF